MQAFSVIERLQKFLHGDRVSTSGWSQLRVDVLIIAVIKHHPPKGIFIFLDQPKMITTVAL